MPIAQDMKSLAERIVGDYENRVSILGNIVSDTHRSLKEARGLVKGFAHDREKMTGQLRKELGEFAGNLITETGDLLKGFKSQHKKMANDQAKDLAKFVENLESQVKKMLKDFESSHADMSEQLKKDLADFVKGLVSETKKALAGARHLVAEYREDISGASEAWQKMTGHMAKLRHGVALKIEKGKPLAAGIEIKEAEEVEIPRRKGRKGKSKKR